MYRKRNQLMELAVCFIDILVSCFSLIIAGMLRYRSFQAVLRAENLQETLVVIIVLNIAAYYFLKVYDGFFQRGRFDELSLSIKYNLILVVGVTFLSFGMKQELFVSRLVMGYFLIINTLLLWCAHIFIRNTIKLFRRSQRNERSILVVTTRDHLEKIKETFDKSKEIAWNIVGAILMGESAPSHPVDDITIIPDTEDAYLEFATLNVVDEVFIQLDSIQKYENKVRSMILEFEQMGVVVNLNLDLFNLGGTGERRIYSLEGYHVVAFTSRLFDYRMVVLKRLIDICGSIIGLGITFVVGIVLWPIMKLDSPGPLIYKQKRVGVNGRVFEMYKFRSMYVDADERKKELMDQNEVNGPMFKMENDPRITRVGRFIRKTSIDELPQFWNVLKGDMSLVGTRPPTLDEYQQYSYYQKRRISFRPGITGLWQISGRSDIKDFDDVVKLDLEYIDNWSLWLDFKIMFKTIIVVFKGKGAE